MRTLALAGGVAAVLAMLGFVAAAIASAVRAVRIGGFRLLFGGLAWIIPPDDIPAAARPHLRKALTRWLRAMGCMILAAGAFALAMASA
ncbi:hypothetical protein [Roseomonas rosulenta]|uniref:hypothetical protein n=1 Tax=Roseomonas rosulenta TaxID=2748667 RepID=UPI0018DF9058|nr:hypothetical protein [Roseomonas rosulenta]